MFHGRSTVPNNYKKGVASLLRDANAAALSRVCWNRHRSSGGVATERGGGTTQVVRRHSASLVQRCSGCAPSWRRCCRMAARQGLCCHGWIRQQQACQTSPQSLARLRPCPKAPCLAPSAWQRHQRLLQHPRLPWLRRSQVRFLRICPNNSQYCTSEAVL